MKIGKKGLAALTALLMVFAMLMITGCPPEPRGKGRYLESIEVHGQFKTIYFKGEPAVLDTTGLVILAIYSDGSSNEVTGYTLGTFDNMLTNVAQTITVEYEDKATYFEIYVIEPLQENQIVLAGTVHLKVNGAFPVKNNWAPELLLLPDGMDNWNQGDVIAWTTIETANFQWLLNTLDLDVTNSPEFRFWVGVENVGTFKLPYSVTLTEADKGNVKQNIEIDIDILTDVTIEGTVGTNNPIIKTLQLQAFSENSFTSWNIDLDDSNTWDLHFNAILKGTEVTFKLEGLDEEKTVVIDSNSISDVAFIFDASFVTGGDINISVRTAFETNNSLYLSNWLTGLNNQLRVEFYDYTNYSHNPVFEYFIYVNGVKKDFTEDYGNFYFSTNGLTAGWNYGTFIVVIDGAAFAKDFSFWVN